MKGQKKWTYATMDSWVKEGSAKARQLPRRYPIYDILEELDETLPAWTIIDEPEEPLQPLEDVPLLERYPWAGELKRVHPQKQEREHGSEERRMMPLYGSVMVDPNPKGRRQKYIERSMYKNQEINLHPRYLQRPRKGEKVEIDDKEHWKRHRTPGIWQLEPKMREEIYRQQEEEHIDENGFVRNKGSFSIPGAADDKVLADDPLKALEA